MPSTNAVKILIETIYKGQGAKQAQKDLKGLGSAGKSIGGTLASIGASVGAAVGGMVAFGVAVKKALDFGAEGAQISRLEDSFQSLTRVAGESGDRLLNALNDAARGTVSNADLIVSANRAMMLGLGADADKLANLLEVAAFRGRAMGLSTTQAFNDIVTGVGRASPMILDNLGIVVDAEKTYEDYAASIGKTKDELSKAEKTQALLTRVLEEGNTQMEAAGGLTEDTAAAYERLDAQAKNLWDTLKKQTGEALRPVAEALGDILTRSDQVTRAFEQSGMSYEEFAQAANDAGLSVAEYAQQILGAAEDTPKLTEALEDTTQAAQENDEAIKSLSKSYASLLSAASTINRESERFTEGEAERTARLAEIADEKVRLQIEQNQVQAAGNLTLEKRNDFMLKQIELDKEAAKVKEDSIKAEQDLQEAANQRIFDQVQAGVAADGISSEEFQRLQELQVQLGLVTQADADRAIAERASADQFIAAISDQTSEVQTLADELFKIPQNSPYRAQIVIETVGSIPTSLGGGLGLGYLNSIGVSGGGLSNMPGFAEGGTFTVPGTGTGDRPYMVGLEPGERVTVTPKDQSADRNVNIYIDKIVDRNHIKYLAQEVGRELQK